MLNSCPSMIVSNHANTASFFCFLQQINTTIHCTISKKIHYIPNQRWSRGHKARGQGHKKKIQGQGQPFRGQTLSKPRTKDTAASVLQKKGLQKSFSGNLQFIGLARIFDWEGFNHKSRATTSSKICLFFT